MESVAQASSRKRSCDTSSDWTVCVFCQKKKPKEPTRKLGEAGIQRVRQAAADRRKYNDLANMHTVERLQATDFDELMKTTDVLNHKDCYATFTSSLHIARLKTKYESSLSSTSTSKTGSPSKPSLRSKVTSMNTDLCIFCQEPSSNKTYLVATFDVSDVRFKMFLKGSKDPEKLAPTQSSLRQHIKRAHHQSTVWYCSLIAQPNICSPVGKGWKKDSTTGHIVPHLMCDEAFPAAYLKITQCQCKNCESHRCSCRLKNLKCTAGCGCGEGMCRNPFNSAQDDSD